MKIIRSLVFILTFHLSASPQVVAHGPAETEDFSTDPSLRGWSRFGAGELFQWNSAEQVLQVTWDSSQTNSYFYRPLGQILSQADDFSLAFDLVLQDIAIGTTPGKPYTFQIALGLVNWSEAIRPDFFRGSGIHPQLGPRSLVEFNYYPDSGFGATVAPTVVSRTNEIAFGGAFPLEMTTADRFHIDMVYSASNRVLRTVMTRNGAPFGLPPDQTLPELSLDGYDDFRVDTLTVASYSDGGQTPPEFAGSILAHGVVDNIRVSLPPPPVQELTGDLGQTHWQLSFLSRTGYQYQMERTTDFAAWQPLLDPVSGTGETIILEDPADIGDHYFYRVRAFKP